MAVPAFPLRIRPDLRDLVREIAAREHISQNELIEQATEHELIARGALLTDDLAAAAAHLGALTGVVHEQLISASVESFAAAEASVDPLRPRKIVRPADDVGAPAELVAVAAFHGGG